MEIITLMPLVLEGSESKKAQVGYIKFKKD